jgi:hypothetical protein
LGLGVRGSAGVFSTQPFYFSGEGFCNHSLSLADRSTFEAPDASTPKRGATRIASKVGASDERQAGPTIAAAVTSLDSVFQLRFAGCARAMDAAKDLSIGLHTMPDDSAVTVRADRRQRVDRAFEAVECVMLSGYDHFKRLVILILANFACSHTQFFRASAALRRCPLGFE